MSVYVTVMLFLKNIDICCIVSEVYVKILCIALVFLCRHLVVVIFGFGSTIWQVRPGC